jgi:hypothetical protein
MQGNAVRPRVVVTGDGRNVAGHAGSRLLCDLADAFGLTAGLSRAMARRSCVVVVMIVAGCWWISR